MASLLGRSLAIGLGIGLMGSGLNAAQACTSFMLQGNDGGRVYGRTMEFAKPLNSDAVLIQRGTALQGAGPSGQSGTGLAWTSRYAVVGMNAVGVDDLVVDGMNERGMAGGLLYFDGYAQFQEVPGRIARSPAGSCSPTCSATLNRLLRSSRRFPTSW